MTSPTSTGKCCKKCYLFDYSRGADLCANWQCKCHNLIHCIEKEKAASYEKGKKNAKTFTAELTEAEKELYRLEGADAERERILKILRKYDGCGADFLEDKIKSLTHREK